MSRPNMENQTAAWLDALTSAESKRHEAAALAIAKSPTYDAHIIAALKTIAHADAQKYARAAAKNAFADVCAGGDCGIVFERYRAVRSCVRAVGTVDTGWRDWRYLAARRTRRIVPPPKIARDAARVNE